MTVPRRLFLVMLGPLLAPALGWPQAAEPLLPPLRIEGRKLARRIQLAGAELRLNGAGVRAVAWFKGFVAALYLGTRASTAAEVLAAPGPKRLQLHLLTDVPAAELGKALRRGVQRNSTPAEREQLAGAVEQLAAAVDAMGTLRKGDVLDLDWDPSRGVGLMLNGTLKAGPRDQPGWSQPALYAAVLRAFIGEKPYDERLKAGLLAPPRSTTSTTGD
jgi:Chalcone isomerase-like